MTGTKYIVVSNDFDKHMIIFPAIINHDQMAKAMQKLRFPKVESAGFIDEFMQCYGESSTLRLKSRDIDTSILKSMLSIDDKVIKFTGFPESVLDIVYK
jgi:hypothetical protein